MKLEFVYDERILFLVKIQSFRSPPVDFEKKWLIINYMKFWGFQKTQVIRI